jgi:hypothetical protein
VIHEDSIQIKCSSNARAPHGGRDKSGHSHPPAAYR